jgi:hypothetical protein
MARYRAPVAVPAAGLWLAVAFADGWSLPPGQRVAVTLLAALAALTVALIVLRTRVDRRLR